MEHTNDGECVNLNPRRGRRSTTNVDLILTHPAAGHLQVIFETACDGAAERGVLRRLARDLTGTVVAPRPKRGTLRTSLHGGSRLVEGEAVCNFSAGCLYMRWAHLHTDVSRDLVEVVEAARGLAPGEQVKMSITTLLNGDPVVAVKTTPTTRDMLLERALDLTEQIIAAAPGSHADRTARLRLAETQAELAA